MAVFPEFITNLPEMDVPFEGASGHLLQGETQQVVFIRFEVDADVPEHSHRSQWELVVAGEVELTMLGETRTYKEGERFFVPEGALHSARAKAGYRAVVFFDQVDRYLPKR